MRGFWITLCPMVAAAALVLWGGERLSRRVVEERQPADRTRLLDFSVALRDELDRLDGLFGKHVLRLCGLAEWSLREELAAASERMVGIRSCHIFEGNGKRYEVAGKWLSPDRPRAPEIEMEGSRNILNPDRTLVLPKDIGAIPGASGWLATPDPNYRAHWRRMESGQLVVFLIDDGELQARLQEHLRKWMQGPSGPLDEAGELYAVSGPKGTSLAALSNTGEAGPAALQIPHRTDLGEWQVYAWDRRRLTSGRDTATLWVSGSLAAILIIAGGFLYIERQRSVRLAEERVSFVNRVSHELGTPLTNILLNLDLVSRSVERNPEEARRRLAMVGEEVRRLARLVANVLTFSRSERNISQSRVVSCVPDEVIAGVLEQFQPSLERRGIRIEWRSDAAGLVLADPDALSQIVGNLISNVEKYGAAGGWLGMTSTLADGRLRVRVADRGPGIAARHEERIFGAFERIASAVNEGSSGTGLGLSIARDLARRGEGELCLIPAPEGAVFELDLPAPPSLP